MSEVTQEDREWADRIIEVEHPNNHEAFEYAVAEVIAAHREAAIKAEREAIAEWLRGQKVGDPYGSDYRDGYDDAIEDAAEAILQGHHLTNAGE